MLFDTGSCEFWVPSSECSSPVCKKHKQYFKTDTCNIWKLDAMNTEVIFIIKYFSGHVKGDYITENVNIGDIIIKNQIIGLAN